MAWAFPAIHIPALHYNPDLAVGIFISIGARERPKGILDCIVNLENQ